MALTDRGELGNNGYYITKIPTRVLATLLLHLTVNRSPFLLAVEQNLISGGGGGGGGITTYI